MKRVDIDTLPVGTLVYDYAGMPLGWIEIHWTMNGNSAAKPVRILNNGRPSDRFAYRRQGLYRSAKRDGAYVKNSERGECRKGEK